MEVWIVEDGEKRGPFHSYEIRGRIENDEFTGDELAWHKDQDGWVPLREMEVFHSEFEQSPEEVEAAKPPPLPPQPHAIARFFARWFDVCLYLLFIYSVLTMMDKNILALYETPGLFVFTYFLPFVLIEGLMLHTFKTTPGKFFLGIRVVSEDEEALPLAFTITRSLRAYILGMGLVHPLFIVPCHIFCIWYLMRYNLAPWDSSTGSRVRVVGPLVYPTLIFVMLFIMILVLLSVLLIPTYIELLERSEEYKTAR